MKKIKLEKPTSGSQLVLQTLKELGVEIIFGYPGGAMLPLYDAIHNFEGIQHILARHEQGATHEAEGYAKSSGKVGVVVVTSGPGATNAVTGIADAYLDSVPLLVFTGQVAVSQLVKMLFKKQILLELQPQLQNIIIKLGKPQIFQELLQKPITWQGQDVLDQ